LTHKRVFERMKAIREPAVTDSILSAPYFHNEEAAYEFVEARL
jgi:hypothetical protein